MPPELPNHQELNLKKRARRRLVGAIALVLLMVIILPMILKDREAVTSQDAIKITMTGEKANETSSNKQPDDFNSSVITSSPKETPVTSTSVDTSTQDSQAINEDKVSEKITTNTKNQAIKLEETNISIIGDNQTSQSKATDNKATGSKITDPKVTDPKVLPEKTKDANSAETKNYTVQIGVFSEMANVKQLQEKIKLAGFNSNTQKINTPKGEKIRLRAGTFVSRTDADLALAKLKQAGLPDGKVVSNN